MVVLGRCAEARVYGKRGRDTVRSRNSQGPDVNISVFGEMVTDLSMSVRAQVSECECECSVSVSVSVSGCICVNVLSYDCHLNRNTTPRPSSNTRSLKPALFSSSVRAI
jgi:hypothetical protein